MSLVLTKICLALACSRRIQCGTSLNLLLHCYYARPRFTEGIKILFDIVQVLDIITVTYDQTIQIGSKARCTCRKWNREPACSGCARSSLCGQQLLRFPRFGTGALRDVAACATGGAKCCAECCPIRSFSPNFLQGVGRLQSRWPGWTSPSQTRTPWATQDYQRSFGIHRNVNRGRRRIGSTSAGREYFSALRNRRTSTDRRARLGPTQKKTITNAVSACAGNALTECYESLRQEVIEPQVRSRSLSGQALLMFKGMAAWMGGMLDYTPDIAPVAPRSDARLPVGVEQNLINIVASMAITTAREIMQ